MIRFYRLGIAALVLFGLAGCAAGLAQAGSQATLVPTSALVIDAPAQAAPTGTATVNRQPTSGAQVQPTDTAQPAASAIEPGPTAVTVTAASAAPTATFDPAAWQDLPVVPELSPRAVEILKDGLSKGNHPQVFSKIGDCESQASWFLGDFDEGPKYYSLGSYQAELQPVIQYYAGSYSRISLAARPGFTAASLMAPIWADKQRCNKDENPLACEIRVNRPAVAFIMLGSNDASNPKTFEGHMRKIIEYTISQGVLPIMGTKADNVEGNHFINQTIARLAAEYQVPLWNYWRAVQPLPDHGLQEDQVHLTFGTPHFDDPAMMKKAWPVRNLNALEILKRVMDQARQP